MSYQDDHFQDNTLDLEDRLEAHILELETFLNLSVIEEFNLDNEDNTKPETSMSESNPASSVGPVLKGIFGNSTALTAAQLASSLTSNKKEDRKGMDLLWSQYLQDLTGETDQCMLPMCRRRD